MTTDPIADMLTRVRNAGLAGHTQVAVPFSRLKEGIAGILKNHGYIAGFRVDQAGAFSQIVIDLAPQQSLTLARISKPGRRVYAKANEIPVVLAGRGLVIVSTSGGLMSGREARQKGLGGELICKVY
jgi:small subunit ribosomal protein S8